ncbi:TRAP transporter small permease [Terasakiella sp. SH-1]|uniref:TRAP transporter small permease n=1 Tax=Terasakiella sp. SH-1 TaxID=2560057 RepID=UPI0010738F00|nr:TRAP transporter small permease [Terasakiella sp. SH-1]
MRHLLSANKATGPLGPVVTLTDTVIRYASAVVLWGVFAAMLIPTFLNAFLRYTTDSSLVWSEQVIQLVFPWFIMAGAVLAAQHNRHIGVELFVSLLPDSVAKALKGVVQLIVIAACVIVVWYGYEVTMFERGTYFTLIGVSQAVSYASLVVGYSLLAITALTTLYRLYMGEVLPVSVEGLEDEVIVSNKKEEL